MMTSERMHERGVARRAERKAIISVRLSMFRPNAHPCLKFGLQVQFASGRITRRASAVTVEVFV